MINPMTAITMWAPSVEAAEVWRIGGGRATSRGKAQIFVETVIIITDWAGGQVVARVAAYEGDGQRSSLRWRLTT